MSFSLNSFSFWLFLLIFRLFKSECPPSAEEMKIPPSSLSGLELDLEELSSSHSEPELVETVGVDSEEPPSFQSEPKLVDSGEVVQDLVDWLIGQCLPPVQALPSVTPR